MIRRTLLAAIPAALLARAARAALAPDATVQLRVRAGGDDLDAAVYDAVFPPFAEVLPLKRAGPFTHTLDVTFSTTGHDWLGAHGGARAGADEHWYIGDRPGHPAEAKGGFVKWQTSHMRAVLSPMGEAPAWSADYDYDGGIELSGWTVKTPAQAARLIARRLAARYRAKPG